MLMLAYDEDDMVVVRRVCVHVLYACRLPFVQ